MMRIAIGPLILIAMLVCLGTFCAPVSIHKANMISSVNNDTSCENISGFWVPSTQQFRLYDRSDSIVFTNIVTYDSLFANAGIKKAILHFKNDTLIENIQFDSCCRENRVKILFDGKQVHYVTHPLLLSNPATGYKIDEFLFLKEMDTLQSTMIFHIDTLQEKRFTKSETSVLLVRAGNMPSSPLTLCK